MNEYPQYTVNDSKLLLYGDPDYDDFNEIIKKQGNQVDQAEYSDDEVESDTEEQKK